MKRYKHLWTFILVGFLAATFSSAATAQNSLIWDASGSTGPINLEATYSELFFGEFVDQILEVRIFNAPANGRAKIFVRGVQIGIMKTNSLGIGQFKKQRTGVPLDINGRPDAPRIETGDLIQVGWDGPGTFVAGEFQPR